MKRKVCVVTGSRADYGVLRSLMEEIKKSSKPIGIGLAFFTTGFVLHLLLQSVGFSKWICDRHTKWGFKCLAQCSNTTYHSDIHPASIMIKN